MFINYEKIGLTLRLFFPKHSKKIWDFCYNKKIEQNCEYIKKNTKKVLKKLQKKKKKEPLKVVFSVYEACRWKSQTIYDLMLQDERFDPIIVVTRINAQKSSSSFQTVEEVLTTYNFFKNKKMNVFLGYDVNKEKFIPLENFKPDIIFYTHPWSNYKTQGPVVCSKFALTYYIPYFLANTSSSIEYNLRFHQYIHKHYVLNEVIKKYYYERQERKTKNMIPVGHPQLDYFYLNNNEKERKTVIYSPHWTVKDLNTIAYATFEWSGKFILEYAKSHPEINWVFKPHPLLYKQLILKKCMTKEEVDNYYNEWKSIAKYYDSGDYLGLFDESFAMITDCGSFLTEYLLTKQPVIHLVSETAVEYNDCVKKIVESYYQAHNIEELNQYLEDVIIKKNDFKKEERLKVLQELELEDNYCAKRILEDIIGEINA